MVKRLYPYIFVILALITVGQWLSINWWSFNLTSFFIECCFCFFILIYPCFKFRQIRNFRRERAYSLFNLYVIYTAILLIYTLINFSIEGQRSDFAHLALYNMAMASCICIYTLSYPQWFIFAWKKLYRFLPWIALVYMPFARNNLFGDLMGFLCMPTILILLFWRDLPRKQKFIWLTFAFIIIISSYFGDARSNVIKYVLALLLGFSIHWDKFYDKIKKIVWIFFIAPFVLFFLGATNIFNVFEADKYLNTKSFKEESIADTRTGIYTEAITSAINNKYVMFGRGIGRGYDSRYQEWFSDNSNASISKLHSSERQAEAGILNIFTWGGIIYILIFTMSCMAVVYYGLYKSKSRFVRNTAFYFAFYYFYSWIENFQSFSIIYLSSFSFIAICLSPYFREMNNDRFKTFIANLLKT